MRLEDLAFEIQDIMSRINIVQGCFRELSKPEHESFYSLLHLVMLTYPRPQTEAYKTAVEQLTTFLKGRIQ